MLDQASPPRKSTRLATEPCFDCLTGAKAAAAKAQAEKQPLRFISSSRANNVAIMLTRFSALHTPDELQPALYSGSAFNLEQLGLLLQVSFINCHHATRCLIDPP